MRTYILLMLVLFFINDSYAQSGNGKSSNLQSESDKNSSPFSFVVGAGVSFIATENFYNKPTIDKATNFVIIEDAGRVKPNITMGLVYTHKSKKKKGTVKMKDIVMERDSATGKVMEMKKMEAQEYIEEPYGFSCALFINPLSFNFSEASFKNTVDLGVGIGYTWNDFSLFLTNEYFVVRQPKQYFIDEYGGNDKMYVIDEATQKSISIDDDSIFDSKVVFTFGVKLVYTIGVINRFKKEAGE